MVYIKKDVKAHNLFIKFITLIIFIILYLLSIVYIPLLDNYNSNLDLISYFFSWVGIFITFYVIVTWYKIEHNFFSPYLIFWVFFFIFNYGQPLMWALGIHLPTEIGVGYTASLGIIIPKVTVVKTQIYTCLCLLAFHSGALFCYKTKPFFRQINKIKLRSTYKAIWLTGILLGIISIPSTIFRSYIFFRVAFLYGYKALYYSSYVSQGGILMILEFFFLPSLICLLIGSRYKKQVSYFVYFIFGIYLTLNLLSGDRGSWVYKLIVFMWLHNQYHKINFKKIIKYFVVGIAFLYIIYAIVAFRNLGLANITFDDLKEIIFGQTSPLIKLFFEMGGSMAILSSLILFPDIRIAWRYGNTYLTAFLGVISTRLLSFLDIPFVLVDNWFSQDYLGISWGTGFSMIGEAYLNGGFYLAPIIIFLLGLIIGSILYINKNIDLLKNPMKYYFVAVSLSIVIGLSRGTIYLYYKQWFYSVLFVYVIIYFISEIFKKRYFTK